MGQTIELRVPEIGDFKDVPVVELSVRVGDEVAVDQTVAMIESDKATLDIPAPTAGLVTALKVAEGDRVSAGSVLMLLEVTEAVARKAARVAATPPTAPKVSGSVQTPELAMVPAPVLAPTSAPVTAVAGVASTGLPPHASPAVRKFARELGVDPALVTGTGPRGRITKEDVQVFIKAALHGPALGASAGTGGSGDGLSLLAWPKVDYAKFGPVERAPLSRIQKISGQSLARNATIIPHVTNFEDADITDLEDFRKRLNMENLHGARLSILPFVVKACVAALKAYPAFNSSLDGDALVLKKYYNIGVAADTPEGLVVPVIKAVDGKSIREIAAEMADLAADARARRLKAPDIQGATFTISSLGGIGGTDFTPIINAPEVAIFGMVRSAIKPVWDGAAFQPRLIQPMSLSWDHRVVDGVAAAKFLVFVKTILADFRRISL